MNLFNLIELEQDILSGINSKGDKISYSDIKKQFNSLKDSINRDNALRLIAILFSCFNLSKKTIMELVRDWNIKDEDCCILSNLQYLGVSFENGLAEESNNPSRRKIHIQSKEKRKEIKLKMKKKIEYNSMRVEPKIVSVIEKCSMYELDKGEFDYVQAPSNSSNHMKERIIPKISDNQLGNSKEDFNDENSFNLIVFMLGGLAHNEICAIERLNEDRRVNHRIILGSTGVMKAKEYMTQLREINNVNDNSIKEVNKEPDSLSEEEGQEGKERDVTIELSHPK